MVGARRLHQAAAKRRGTCSAPSTTLDPATAGLVAVAAQRRRLDRRRPATGNANFYFGSFGNNYLDGGTVRRYRDLNKLPGFGIDAISAQSFARTLLEWTSRRWCSSRPARRPFTSPGCARAVRHALWTDPNRSASRALYGNVGGQLDLRFSVLHWYETTLSVATLSPARRRAQEQRVMVSLKIM